EHLAWLGGYFVGQRVQGPTNLPRHRAARGNGRCGPLRFNLNVWILTAAVDRYIALLGRRLTGGNIFELQQEQYSWVRLAEPPLGTVADPLVAVLGAIGI